jgi:hypothetical protein
MKQAEVFFLLAGIISSLLLITGLRYPFALLWWKDVQSRRMVIKLYGRVAAFCILTYSLLRYTLT